MRNSKLLENEGEEIKGTILNAMSLSPLMKEQMKIAGIRQSNLDEITISVGSAILKLRSLKMS
jgi:hypothetical protein